MLVKCLCAHEFELPSQQQLRTIPEADIHKDANRCSLNISFIIIVQNEVLENLAKWSYLLLVRNESTKIITIPNNTINVTNEREFS